MTAIALLALAAVQTAPVPAAPPLAAAASTPVPARPAAAVSPDIADERCIAALAYLGNGSGSAVQVSRYGPLFFYGKLMGRDPGIDLSAGLRRAVTEIGGTMQSEITRCSQEVEAASQAMAAAGTAARDTPTHPPQGTRDR